MNRMAARAAGAPALSTTGPHSCPAQPQRPPGRIGGQSNGKIRNQTLQINLYCQEPQQGLRAQGKSAAIIGLRFVVFKGLKPKTNWADLKCKFKVSKSINIQKNDNKV